MKILTDRGALAISYLHDVRGVSAEEIGRLVLAAQANDAEGPLLTDEEHEEIMELVLRANPDLYEEHVGEKTHGWRSAFDDVEVPDVLLGQVSFLVPDHKTGERQHARERCAQLVTH